MVLAKTEPQLWLLYWQDGAMCGGGGYCNRVSKKELQCNAADSENLIFLSSYLSAIPIEVEKIVSGWLYIKAQDTMDCYNCPMNTKLHINTCKGH